MPQSLVSYFSSLTKPGAFLPHNYLSNFEMNLLNIDPETGILISCSNNHRTLMLGGLILIKILIGKVLGTTNLP